MRGAPWDGLFYGFVVLAILLVGALTFAVGTEDFLLRTLSWAVAAACTVGLVRLVRRALRQPPPDRVTGRWWFGG